jgi:hypothetical protein
MEEGVPFASANSVQRRGLRMRRARFGFYRRARHGEGVTTVADYSKSRLGWWDSNNVHAGAANGARRRDWPADAWERGAWNRPVAPHASAHRSARHSAWTGGRRPALASGTAMCGGVRRVAARRRRARVAGVETPWCGSVQPKFSPHFQTKVHKELISKVVDLATIYNFYKG